MELAAALGIRDEFVSNARTMRAGRLVRSMVLSESGESIAPAAGRTRPLAVSLGVALTENEGDFRVAVRSSAPREMLEQEFLPALAERAGGEVDVLFLGRIRARQAVSGPIQTRVRPPVIGCSCGHSNITAGTLGAFARDRATGRIGILSNNHVLADTNAGHPGDEIWQPGKFDEGTSADTIARLERFVSMSGDGNLVDAAFAYLDADPGSYGDIAGQVTLTGRTVKPRQLMRVVKHGRTTGFTKGRITATDLIDVEVDYEGTIISFDSQIEIRSPSHSPFSAGGDSGSLVVTPGGDAVGLLFGGGPTADGTQDVTFVNEIDNVLSELDIDLAS